LGEHIGEPDLGIDAVELGGVDQRQHDRGALAAAAAICSFRLAKNIARI
jgi:hypothetical protein